MHQEVPVEIEIECHRLEALMDTVAEFTPELTSETVLSTPE